MKIEEKLEQILKEARNDEWTDEENEAIETMKELAKLFGGKMNGRDSVSLYPFKKGDEWEVFININDYDPFEYDVTVNLHSGPIGMDGDLSFITEEITEKMIRDIGKLQKVYYDAVQTVINGLGKMGDLDI